MTVLEIPARLRILGVLRRWREERDGLPTTWDVLRAAGLAPSAAADLDVLATEGVVDQAGRARDGSRLWRLSPAGRGETRAET